MSRYNIVRESDYADDSTANANITPFPIPLVPLCLGAFRIKSSRYFYTDTGSWLYARQSIHQMGANMLRNNIDAITNRQDALYNLLDAALGGIERSVTGTGTSADPFIYDRPIPQVKTRNSFFADVSFEEGILVNSYLTRVKTKATDDDLYAIFTGDTAGSSVEGMRVTYDQLEDALTKLQTIIDNMESGGGPTFEQIAEIIALLGI